jgi:small subunit ribosomal protein S11
MADENIKDKQEDAKETTSKATKSNPTQKTANSAKTDTKISSDNTATKIEEATPKKAVKSKKKAKRRLLTEGKVYIQSSFNNTIVTVTDPKGEVIAWASSGSSGFKGPRKATPYAAQIAAESAITKAKAFGLERVRVYIKGAGTGREQAVRGLQAGGVNIDSLTDITPVPHNGCRPRKGRRV